MSDLEAFVRESNLIEGIARDPTPDEIAAHERFLALFQLSIPMLCELQKVLAPGHPLRLEMDMNVRVGNYVAPRGGPEIKRKLNSILKRANDDQNPWSVHCSYEMLHPFCDGNGRTARAIWAWQMRGLGRGPFALPFLHRFYYQTLENSRQ